MSDTIEIRSEQGKTIIQDGDGNTITVSRDALPKLVGELLLGMNAGQLRSMAVHVGKVSPEMERSLRRGLALGILEPERQHVSAAMNVDAAVLTGLGNEWRKGRKHRIYFDPLQGWFGLKILRFPEGAIERITLRGEEITTIEAQYIIGRFRESKIYFDLGDQCFHGAEIEKEDFDFIVEQICTVAGWGISGLAGDGDDVV